MTECTVRNGRLVIHRLISSAEPKATEFGFKVSPKLDGTKVQVVGWDLQKGRLTCLSVSGQESVTVGLPTFKQEEEIKPPGGRGWVWKEGGWERRTSGGWERRGYGDWVAR